MLLRSVTEHVRSQNWTAVVIDFVIVVVGVFIGIQVSNWNADRQNADRTQSYYERLTRDLEGERLALHSRLNYQATVRRYGEAALASLDDPEQMRSTDFLVALYQASQIWTYSVQRATYDEILNSGVADTIPDPALRTLLANTYLNAEAMRQIITVATPFREHIRRYLPHDIQTAVRQHCGDNFVRTDTNLVLMELPERCDLEFNESQIDAALQALQAYTELKPELGRRLAALDNHSYSINGHLPLIDQLLQAIDRHRVTSGR